MMTQPKVEPKEEPKGGGAGIELTGAENVLLVVSRWFGGILLGPDRFKCFAKAGSELLEAEGLASRGKGKRK